MTLFCYIDGSCQGNPGHSGYGVVLEEENGNTLEMLGDFIGNATNNIAEYQALIACLHLTKKYDMDTLIIYSDSQLVVNQIKGLYKIKKDHIKSLFDKAQNIINTAPYKIEIIHIPREKNKKADKLARKAIQLKTKITDLV
ncbi:MAG: ribonuclease HI family protein [bacterium]